MARGWESKSIEEQQSLKSDHTSGQDALRQAAAARAVVAREKQALELQRERVLSERTASPVRRAALETALAHIESRLALLN